MPLQNLFGEQKIQLTGYIQSENDVQDDDNADAVKEDEEEEAQPSFLNMKEDDYFSSGGKNFESSVPALKEVSFVAKKTYQVKGHFHLCDPWWKITCTVHRDKSDKRKFLTHPFRYPSYSLCTDFLRSESVSLVSLFLKKCKANPVFVNMFMQWLAKNNCWTPANVLDALQEFEVSSPGNKAVAEQLESSVKNSVAWTHVSVARMYPQIMKYLPTLLPDQFMRIISNRENGEETPWWQINSSLLDNLEELIKTDVWKFGFNHIMLKEFHINCEAEVEALRCSKYLLSRIPEVQQNALRLYAELKKYCRNTGSTYIEHKMLLEKWKNTFEGAMFLQEQGVLIKENNKVALRNLFTYEKGIAECLRGLVEGEPWKIHLDVREVLRRAERMRLWTRARDARTSASEQNDLDQGAAEAQPGSSSMSRNGGMGTHCDSPQSFEVFETIEEEDPDPDSNNSTYSDIGFSTVELDPDQVRAAEMMCANPVTVISGKGGCGKTTVVCLVFKAAMEQQISNRAIGNKTPVEVLLTAPTGRAASLLTKRTGFTAYTMHQILWSFRNAEKDTSGNTQDWKFSKVRVLVVDEGSLVSVQILHSVLSMLTKHAELQKFIMLGDVRQLPSIEPGNALCDLFEGLKNVRWAIEMKTNHRAESELIARNAGLISEMAKKRCYSPLEFDATINMTSPSTVPSDKKFIFVKISEKSDALQEAIQFLLKDAPGLENHKSSQIVAFMRKDCKLINEICCKHYSNHVTKTHDNKICFQVGDKVCCTKNGYISRKDEEKNLKDHVRYTAGTSCFNVGASQYMPRSQKKNKQMTVKKDKICIWAKLDDENGCVVTCDYSELQRECKLRHAWARTIHTFQGSEVENIVYVLRNSFLENWQHVYTAVTRGQKRVYVVGTERDLEGAIKKWITPRNTRLCGLLKAVVAQQGPEASKRFADSDSCATPSKLTKEAATDVQHIN
ncbi:DNA helicase B-like [Pseudorasbora parva]|uniref:DNA helicase B-like n=1 Tax=Pseudorasbora parva TaxID=51549 RepID=UPI00351E84A3